MAIFPQTFSRIDARCSRGERRVLHQLRRCLEDDCLVWHDLPIGPKARQPDFVVLSPRWGLLVLEVKDWLLSSIAQASPTEVTLATERGEVQADNPVAQARGYVLELVDVLRQDPVLTHVTGPFQGQLLFPYGWGVVFAGIEEKQVSGSDFFACFSKRSCLLKGDLSEGLDEASFIDRLAGMFTLTFPHTLTLPQRDRIRWHILPELRMPIVQPALDGITPALDLPDLMRVMDVQQEQVARSLGEGHRVIHGAAGSGKTMILVFRAQHLAATASVDQPILVLCFNSTLAGRIDAMLRSRGIDERVVVRTFHAWCSDVQHAYNLEVPHGPQEQYFERLAYTVERALETKRVPAGQYSALLIDEAHDFEDAWLKIATQLVSPQSKSLLVLYDDAQSIYQRAKRSQSFAQLGIQAKGRTSVLKLNYRNTAEILQVALGASEGVLPHSPKPDENRVSEAFDRTSEDGIPTVAPASAGRRGPMPKLHRFDTPLAEAQAVAQQIADALAQGTPPGELAVLGRNRHVLRASFAQLKRLRIPCQSMSEQEPRSFDWREPSVKLLTIHSSKGLEFSHVFIAGLQTLPQQGEPLQDELRLLYVAMTRATRSLWLSATEESVVVARVQNAIDAAAISLG